MARAGFAGSLVVDANWKGRNLNRGMRDSQKRVQGFGKSIRRIAGAVALGAGGVLASKGLIGLLKMSKKGSEAWSNWLMAWEKLKTSLANLLAGPAEKLLNWAAGLAGDFAGWLGSFDSWGELWDDLVARAKKLLGVVQEIALGFHDWALKKAIDIGLMDGMISATVKLMGLWQKIVDLFISAAAGIQDLAASAASLVGWGSGGGDSSPGLYSAAGELGAAPKQEGAAM